MADDDQDKPTWQPLNIRDTPAAADYEALAEGIPPWLESSLWRWVMDRAARVGGLSLKAERFLKIKMPREQARKNVFDTYWGQADEGERLVLIDFFLRDLEDAFAEAKRQAQSSRDALIAPLDAADSLKRILVEGGSVWTITSVPYWGLVRRNNETTQALVDLASTPSTDAARKIASAWSACYRRDPDYDRAYRDAVLAVEAVALPVMVPKDTSGTLGKVVSHLASTEGRWTVGGLDAPKQETGATLLAMLRTLWHNQERHALADGTIRDVGQQEAEAAVTMAVTLVHWFASGLVSPRD